MKLICESCEHGYDATLGVCSWCGCSSTFAHVSHKTSCLDIEVYQNYFLVRFDTGEIFQMFDGHALDIPELVKTLSRYTIVTFNGINYDIPLIGLAIDQQNCSQIKEMSDLIIIEDVKPWELLLPTLPWIDHIDLIEVAPGKSSLKAYGAKMHTKRLQDLPYSPNMGIEWPHRVMLREYCGNDLKITRELFDKFQAQIKLREDMSLEYNVDLRSKSDAQIAEAVMKQCLDFKVQKPIIPPGANYKYHAPDWLSFVQLDLLYLLSNTTFTVGDAGNITVPESLSDLVITIGKSSYRIRIGGLHSTEESRYFVSDDNYVLRDHDVASYYPSLILRTGIAPEQIGSAFIYNYTGWYKRRLDAKRTGNKKTANSLKTLLNGTFGKLGSKYSIFYAPAELIQVTITGQLAILMLIEQLELAGISVISANTDGIVLYCDRRLEWVADSIIKAWELITQFETERTDYTGIYSRDVNSYIAIEPNGSVKLKGAFAPAEPGASGWPNPTGQICVDAMVGYLRDGVPIEQTIYSCVDVRKFIYARAVRGGGVLCNRPFLPKKTTKKEQARLLAAYDCDNYESLYEWSKGDAEYLGKVVRWYYATGSTAHIRYQTSGNMVPRSTGCKPCMELPTMLPADIDYAWYINETRSLLHEVGYA